MSENVNNNKKPKIIFVGNYKGGVGKTTSVFNFASYFAEKKSKKVLVMDIDPQGSLSEILINNNYEEKTLKDLKPNETLNYVIDLSIKKIKKYKSINLKFDEKIIQKYEKYKFDFIPSSLYYNKNVRLDDLVIEMEDTIEYLSILKTFIDNIIEIKKDRYDYIFIDCPPSHNLITKSAILASDYYIIPTILDTVSANGVLHYIQTVESIFNYYINEKEDNIIFKHYFGEKSPELLGIFITMLRKQVDNENPLEEFKEQLNNREDVKALIRDNKINNYIDIARSTGIGEISEDRNDYEQLIEELFNDLENK